MIYNIFNKRILYEKILKFVLPTSAAITSLTPLLVACSHAGIKYDFSWRYIYSNGRWNPFVPSTTELPEDTKTNHEATKMYANAIAQNNVLMTDDFFYTGNQQWEDYKKPQYNGTHITQYISFLDSVLEETKYSPDPMILLSFKFKIHMHLVINEEWNGDYVDSVVFTKYPFYVSYDEAKESWKLLAFGWADETSPTIDDRLKQDTNWQFSYKTDVRTPVGPTTEEEFYDYTIADATDQQKKTFKKNLKYFGKCESYYLSQLTYQPESQK